MKSTQKKFPITVSNVFNNKWLAVEQILITAASSFPIKRALSSFPPNKANARIVKFDCCGNYWLRALASSNVNLPRGIVCVVLNLQCLLLMLSLEVFQINSSRLIRVARTMVLSRIALFE